MAHDVEVNGGERGGVGSTRSQLARAWRWRGEGGVRPMSGDTHMRWGPGSARAAWRRAAVRQSRSGAQLMGRCRPSSLGLVQ
jgi:hypothetical protein